MPMESVGRILMLPAKQHCPVRHLKARQAPPRQAPQQWLEVCSGFERPTKLNATFSPNTWLTAGHVPVAGS